MGRPKALLPWNGVPLIAYQVAQLQDAGVDDVVVVLGHAADEVRPEVPTGCRVLVNVRYKEGRATSLRAGAGALPDDADPIIVLDVDRPRPAGLLRTLQEAHRGADALITRQVSGGKHGHPIVVAGALLEELRQADDETQGLRGIVDAHRGQLQDLQVDDPTVLVEFNTPEEYEAALAKFGQPREGALD